MWDLTVALDTTRVEIPQILENFLYGSNRVFKSNSKLIWIDKTFFHSYNLNNRKLKSFRFKSPDQAYVVANNTLYYIDYVNKTWFLKSRKLDDFDRVYSKELPHAFYTVDKLISFINSQSKTYIILRERDRSAFSVGFGKYYCLNLENNKFREINNINDKFISDALVGFLPPESIKYLNYENE